jgi:hypothetical protein
MNMHVPSSEASVSDTELVLAALRRSYLRVRMIETEIASVGVALKGGLISPEVALVWTDEIGLEELERRAELRRQEEVGGVVAGMKAMDRPTPQPKPKPSYRTAESTVGAFWYVVAQRDPDQLKTWLAAHPKDAPFLLKLLKDKQC